MSSLFGVGVKARSAAYDLGIFATRRVEGVTVISVGNLKVGGSGKTPLAMHLAKLFQDAHIPTSLVLRGYGGDLEQKGALVSNGDGPLISFDEAGDEAHLAATRLPKVQVRIGADRVSSAQKAASAGKKLLILDDGFSHRRLHRDLDILLVSPNDLDPSTKLLPAGPLREPASAAKRAQIVCGLEYDWEGHEEKPKLLMDHIPTCLIDHEHYRHDLRDFTGAPAFAVCAIARPKRFIKTIGRAGMTVVGKSFYPDHHKYTSTDIQAIEQNAKQCGADLVVTTEKDLAKLLDAGLCPFALRIDVKITRGNELLLSQMKKLGFDLDNREENIHQRN